MPKQQLTEEQQSLFREMLDHFDKEDLQIRERQILQWRRLKLLWEGFSRTWYSEVAHDWRIWDQTQYASEDTSQSVYDKPVNVFRAYLESIIAALSVTVPKLKCYPDDADNTLDLATAKAGDKISELIFRHNNVDLLWVHALFIFCTEGLVACHNYIKSDEKFGTYTEKKYENYTEEHQVTTCSQCGYEINSEPMTPEEAEFRAKMEAFKDEFMPGDSPEDIQIQEAVQEPELCPNCQMMMVPEIASTPVTVSRIVGETKNPKSRVCMDVYGGLYVKVPNYAKKQEDCPYLIFSYETHFANAIQKYAHLHDKKDKLTANKIKSETGAHDPYEQWGRLSPQYGSNYPENVVTVRNCWFRPSAFNVIDDEDEMKTLAKKFPNGAKVVFINDEFAEACNESLDDYWTLTHNPLSDFIHHDPLGLLLVSIQDITNDLISLILQTIEHGIGQTFADPTVVDFDAYRQSEAIPGGIYEAKPKSGARLGDAFHEVKTATLSPEVMPFAQNIQSMAQLVSGALPSLFGGAIEGSETASQYSMSRNQALQRLQNTWKIFTAWWKEIFGKAVPSYIKIVQEDEREVSMTKDGSFINTFIRKAELEGKIGRIELEASENVPLTWAQQKDVVMQLLEAQNPEILAILGSPENMPVIRRAIGLTDFSVPGEDDRNKTYDDIKLLLDSTPIPGMPDPMNPTAPSQDMPSVEVDPIFDNHDIAFDIVRRWVVSEAGRQAKIDNPEGYKNVLLYGQQLFMFVQQQQMMEQQAPPAKPGENTETPVTGESDVKTV